MISTKPTGEIQNIVNDFVFFFVFCFFFFCNY